MSLVDLGKRLLESAKLGETEEVRILMTNGAPFTTDWLGTSPLHMAAQYGHLTTAEVLLRGGISRDARTKVDRTPLHIAAQEGHLDIVEVLVNHGAEVDARDMLKMTPLHWAVERGHYHVAKFLLNNEADVNALSKFDKSPLDIAEDNQHVELIELLIKHQRLWNDSLKCHLKIKQHAANPGSVKPYHEPKEKTTPVVSSNVNSTAQTIKTVPLIIKSEAYASSELKHAKTSSSVVQTISTFSHVSSSTAVNSTVNTSPLKSSTISKPVFLRANLTNVQKAAAATTRGRATSSSDSEEGETSEQNCTNVLATLAALAEATAPNNTISTSEAMQWLEMNGIAMLPTDNSTVVASAIEGGQTVSLTEAGKLALTWVKEHQNFNNNSSDVSSSISEAAVNTTVTSAASSAAQKVITILAEQSQIPSIISSPQTPIVVLSSQTVPTTVVESIPPVKKVRLSPAKNVQDSKVVTNGTASSPVVNSTSEDEKLILMKELERTKKEAELYKARYIQTQHEAQQYKKELDQIKTRPSFTP